MSPWAKYLKERLNVDSIETPRGFITYNIRDGVIFVNDLFVLIEHRKSGALRELFELLWERAPQNEEGIRRVDGRIWLKIKGSEEMLAITMQHGFKLISSDEKSILISKEGV